MILDYDVLIIGGGAGLKIARPAADLGFKVAVMEPGPLGGTCLNRGCIPSKMLIHPADLIQQIKEAGSVQLKGKVEVDFPKLIERVNQTIDQESQSIRPLFDKHPYLDFYPEAARFISSDLVEVQGKKIRGKKVFIATGGRPTLPNIEGLEKTPFMTSTELLRCSKLPKKMLIVGAGYIACELGHYLDAMGVEVQFIVRSSFLRHLDQTLQKHFEMIFSKRFKVFKGEPRRVTYENSTFTLYLDEDQKLKADGLLIAIGTTPNTDQLGLEHTEVRCNTHGFIQVNDHLETTQKNIFAFGDVIGRYLFRHSANFEGEYLFDQHFKKKHPSPIEYPPVPFGVFTWPQIAGVGKTEEELIREKVDYFVGENAYKNSAMGMALNQDEGLVKLLFDKKTRALIGAHIIGEQATTMIHMLIAYINCKATLDQILHTIYIHPALPEIIRNAARRAKQKLIEE